MVPGGIEGVSLAEVTLIDHLPKVRTFMWIVGAGFPNNGLSLEAPATIKCERTFGKWSMRALVI